MTVKLKTISAAGCEVRMGLAILVALELRSPTAIFCWSCVLMDYPSLCLIGQQILKTQHQIFTL